MKIILKVHW